MEMQGDSGLLSIIWFNDLFSRVVGLLFVIALACLTGCQSHEGIPVDMTFSPAPLVTQSLAEYTIQPRDQLDVKFFYSPELNESLTVRPDGKIALQLVGEVDASGLTPAKLQQDLQHRYATHLKEPEITVILKSFSDQQVFIDGEVERPGMVELTSGLSAWQAIIKAGGFKESATRENVLIIRQGKANRPMPYQVDLKSDSLNQPDSVFILQPHDIVYVPKTAIAEADKFVAQYIEKLMLFKGWYFNLSPFGTIIK
jgi:protein involved in polysaccharide export with SLBB domain